MIGIDVISPNEHNCLEYLEQYQIINAKSDPVVDKLVAIMAKMWNVPLGMINFIDDPAVWSASEQIASAEVYSSEDKSTISSIAIWKDCMVKFEELIKNPGLILNPMALGEHGLRFFASVPIIANDGLHVGTACIAGEQHINFDHAEQAKLERIANMVTNEMTKRKTMNMF